ncbi:MAG TPA: aldo/keto reductase [Aliiroseovarius sp.]|nr:aldo/keto reductase [Aliiroseovarius sp.]
MKTKELAGGDLRLSALCLGAMNFGGRMAAQDAHRQIDTALAHGVNCIDTAEMYPVNPISPETVGHSEGVIGDWIAQSGRRGEMVLATKISGANGGWIRDGRGFDGVEIRAAVDASLSRLQTDYIDIYQLHWPNRGSYHFRQNWDYDASTQDRAETDAHMRDVLAAMADVVAAGKVRHFGLSNETAWGTARWIRLAHEMGAPAPVTIQNEYSLLCRSFDTDLAELCAHEDMALLAFSPLATGLLSGKYAHGAVPEGSRMASQPELGGRNTAPAHDAVAAYQKIADRHGLNLTQMALAFCISRPFMGTTIFGASDAAQLDLALAAADLELSDDVISEINAAHKVHPMPY